MNYLNIPCRVNGIYEDRVRNFTLACTPLAMNGIHLLMPMAKRILDQCDGSSSIGDIIQSTAYSDKSIFGIVDTLWRNGLVKINGKILPLTAKKNSLAHIDAWFHITNDCNLRCSYCYIRKTKGSMAWEVARQTVNGLVRTALLNRKERILIKFAGGEPLLQFPLMQKVVDYSRNLSEKNGVAIDFHLVTNGTCITKKIAGYLKEMKINVSVSLDGLAKYNDRQRAYPNGKGSFEDVQKGIYNLIDLGVPSFVLITVTSLNLPGLPDFTDYLLNNNIGFRYSLYRDLFQQHGSVDVDPDEAIKVLSECYDIFETNLPKKDLPLMHQLCDIRITRRRKRNCGAGSNGIVIGHRGEIAICQATLEQVVGDITETDFLKLIRKQKQYEANKYSVDTIPRCQNCLWRYICGGGCPLLTKAVYGKFDKESPYCEVFKVCIPRLIRIMGLQIIRNYQARIVKPITE